MKRISVPCTFGDNQSEFELYLGDPAEGFHPLHFQQAWLRQRRGGSLPRQLIESLNEAPQVAETIGETLEELCAATFTLDPVAHLDLEKARTVADRIRSMSQQSNLRYEDACAALRRQNTGIIRGFMRLEAIAGEHNVLFEDLFRYAVTTFLDERKATLPHKGRRSS